MTHADTYRYLVRRYRGGEAAPSLSLSYLATSHDAALSAHLSRYPGGVADDETYTVFRQWTVDPAQAAGDPMIYSADEARDILRRTVA